MPNKLEVTLGFKPVMDGLDRFVKAIESRMERVRAFNLRIENGAKATNQLLAQAATVLGVNQLKSYIEKAGEAAKAQAQLVTATARQGQYSESLITTLNDHADALERLTNFEGEEVSAVQRQLISYRVTRAELQAMTEATLDLAAALGTNATSAALLIGKTLQGDQEELGRYGIRIDQTKDRVVALREAIQRFAGGQARAQVAFPELRRAAVEIDQAQKSLGRNLATALGPLIGGFATGLGKTADLLARITGYVRELGGSAENLRPLGEMLGKATIAALAILGPLLVIRALMTGLPAVINPVRMAFVFLAGIDFVDAVRDVQAFSRELGILQTLQVANWAQRLSAAIFVVGAAFAGWQIGSFLNELEVGGMRVKDWAARVVNAVIGLFEALGAWKDVLKFKAMATATEAIAKLKELYWQGALSIVEALNMVLGRFGKAIPTDALRQAVAEARKELKQLQADNTAAIMAAEAVLARVTTDRGEIDDAIARDGRAGVAKPAAAPAATNGTPEEALKSKEARAKELAEIKAALDLERLQLEQAYELKIVDLEAYLAKRDELLQRAIAAEKKLSDTPPGKAAVALALAQEAADQAKLRRETTDKERQLKFAEQEQTLSEKLGAIAQKRAAVEGNLYATAEQKRPRLLQLLRDENALLDEKIKRLDTIIAQEVDPEKRLKFRQEREQTAQQRADNNQAIDQAQPQSVLQGALQGVAGQGGFLESIGTAAQNAAQTVNGTLNAALQGTSGLIQNLWLRTKSWGDAWRGMIVGVGQQFSQMIADQIAKIIFRYTIETALMKLGLVEKIATNKAALADEAITAGIMKLLWAPVALLKSIATGGVAAVLGVAAVIAAVAAFGGFRADGGPVEAGKTYIVGERGPEPFVPASDGYIFPSVGAMDSALAGSLTRPSAAARSGGGAAGAAAGGFDPERVNITVIQVASMQEAKRIDRQSRARGDIVRIVAEDFGLPPRNRG